MESYLLSELLPAVTAEFTLTRSQGLFGHPWAVTVRSPAAPSGVFRSRVGLRADLRTHPAPQSCSPAICWADQGQHDASVVMAEKAALHQRYPDRPGSG
jgi:hypothetical protein